jgi:hypothetical protein
LLAWLLLNANRLARKATPTNSAKPHGFADFALRYSSIGVATAAGCAHFYLRYQDLRGKDDPDSNVACTQSH